MDPVMRIVLAIVGAFAGATLGSPGSLFFDTLIGAFAGFAIADLSHIRACLRTLDAEIARLKSGLARGAQASADHPRAAPPDVAPPAPALEPAAHRPAQPHAQQPPNFISDRIRRFFGGGNLLVRSGVIVLFFGIAFLLRYVAQHTRVRIEYRLSGVALGGLALLVLGWRLRTSRPGFALSLQGGAVGILYLSGFAAFHLYALMPPVAAFALLTSIAALSVVLAAKQDSQSLALLGVTGGFLAPILASGGNGDHVFLFGYYAVLNAGILLVSWFKSWRGRDFRSFLCSSC